MKLKIATTGLSGLVGTRLRELLHNEFDFIEVSQSDVNITDKEEVVTFFANTEADILLHLAAFTNVDACETDKETAWQVNVEGTRNLFDVAQEKNMKFIYMSTGFVFDGEHGPFYEDSQPNPISYYGLTKLEGEKIIADKGMIVRIDYPYGSIVEHKKDFVTTLVDALRENKPIKGITDQIFTPTYIDDIANAFRHLFNNFSTQTFHIVGSDSLSGYDVIKIIGDVYGIDTSWVGETTYDEFYRNKARRPKNNTLLSKNNTFSAMKTFREGVELFFNR